MKKRGLWSKTSEYLLGIRSRRDPAEFFVIVMAVSFFAWILTYLFVGDGGFSDLFFIRNSDLFMDFFNSMRDAAQFEGVYTERGVIYPPLANLIFLILSQLAPHGYNNTSFDDRKEWINYSSSILLVTLLVAFCAMVLYAVFREGLKKPRALACLFGFFAVCNASVLYMLERGNILILCLIALSVFGFGYNSEKRASREAANVALAVAIALKLYPALFLWVYIADKRYKDLFKCVAYSAVLIIVPSFFFGGPECLFTLFENMFRFSSKKSSGTSAVTVIRELLHLSPKLFSVISYAWCAVNLGSFMLSAIKKDEAWKLWVKGIILILVVPSLTSQYTWSFLLVAIALLSNARPAKRSDIPMLVAIFIPFIFTVFRFNYYVTINTILTYLCTSALSIICVIDTLRTLLQRGLPNAE